MCFCDANQEANSQCGRPPELEEGNDSLEPGLELEPPPPEYPPPPDDPREDELLEEELLPEELRDEPVLLELPREKPELA